MAFQNFPRLPCELRTMIFDEVLRNETQHRLLVLSEANQPDWEIRIHPFADLVSPLLSVNRISRDVAQRFYTCKLAVYEVPQRVKGLSCPDYTDRYWARKADAWFQDMARSKVSREKHAEYRGMLYLNLERDIVTTGGIATSWRPTHWRPTDMWARLSAAGPRHYITEALGETDRLMVRRCLVVAAKPGGHGTTRFRCMCHNRRLFMVSKAWADLYWQVHRFPRLSERLELVCRSGTVEDEFIRDRAANRDRMLNWPAYETRRWSESKIRYHALGGAAHRVFVQRDKLVQPGFWTELWDLLRYWVYVAIGWWFAAASRWFWSYLDMFARLGMHQL
ncbi:hypothetical protein PG985_004927 [Apiospora marii]|uniref:2EXR domain-containing protein n=1 Tax=Apiospora marii TaxID=335849 RepID=A0ABR1SAJ2_9PEZI